MVRYLWSIRKRKMDNRLQNALNLCNNNKFEEVLILLEEVIKVDRRSKTSRRRL